MADTCSTRTVASADLMKAVKQSRGLKLSQPSSKPAMHKHTVSMSA